MYITVADLMLVTYCLVDDWYQRTGARLVGCTVGPSRSSVTVRC
jgi:hypothetical protein